MLAPTSIRYYTMYQKEPCRSEIVYFSLYPANLQLFSDICKKNLKTPCVCAFFVVLREHRPRYARPPRNYVREMR